MKLIKKIKTWYIIVGVSCGGSLNISLNMKCLQILKERNHASINHLFEASLVPPPLLQSIDLSLYTSVKSESRKTGGVQSRHRFINEAQSRVEGVVFVHGVAVSS